MLKLATHIHTYLVELDSTLPCDKQGGGGYWMCEHVTRIDPPKQVGTWTGMRKIDTVTIAI